MPSTEPRYTLAVPRELVLLAQREAQAHRPRLPTSQILLEALYRAFGPSAERESQRIKNGTAFE